MEKDLGKLKKDLQKVISAIRKERQQGENVRLYEFPKAMMTNQQMWKDTATVNCGGQWASKGIDQEIANLVMGDDRFQQFLEKWDANAGFEKESSGAVQIRINY